MKVRVIGKSPIPDTDPPLFRVAVGTWMERWSIEQIKEAASKSYIDVDFKDPNPPDPDKKRRKS